MRGNPRADGEIEGGHKTAALAEKLRCKLEAGEVPVGGFTPSERELSRTWSVGKMTVRRALKLLQKKGYLSAERGRGYRVLGRALDPARGFPVAFVVSPSEAHLFSANSPGHALVSAFQRHAAENRIAFVVVGLGGGGHEDIVEQLKSRRICGVVLDSSDPELVGIVQRSGVPAVAAEAARPGMAIDSVLQDGAGGALLAAEHLVSRGHRRIGYLGPDVGRGDPLVVDRYSGVVGGLARARTKLAREKTGLNRDEAMREAALKLLSGPKRPTAILALWQTATSGLVQAARELGLVVGKDFEMVGWSTEEDYETGFRILFEGGNVPPAIVWRAASMVETVLERLEVRRGRPDLPAIQLRIPAALRLAGE